jgi:thiamine biosynthesis lipoprotein
MTKSSNRERARLSCGPLGGAMVLMLIATQACAEWYVREDTAMGTAIRVEFADGDPAHAEAAYRAVTAEMRRVDELMSTYKPGSVLSRVNAEAAERAVPVPAELTDLVGLALEYSALTHGAFDITYASVGYLYDFRAHVHPDDAAIARALPGVDYRHVAIDRNAHTIRFDRTGVRVDLGGIAKGHAVDRSIAILRRLGIEHALVTAGGDTRLLGDRLGQPFMVGVRDPRSDAAIFLRLPLVDEAISTSGDYERFFEEDGRRYHHILVPGTGKPAGAVRSATVIGPHAVDTDALSTGVFVLGVDAGMRLIDTLEDFETVIVDADGGVHYSAGLVEP